MKNKPLGELFANHILHKALASKVYKELFKLNNNTYPNENKDKTLQRHFAKENI